MAWPSKNHPTAIHKHILRDLTPFWSGLFFPFEPSAMDESKNKTMGKKSRKNPPGFCGACDYDVLMPFSVLHLLYFFCARSLVFIHMGSWTGAGYMYISETGLTLSVECLACFSSGYGSNSSSGSSGSSAPSFSAQRPLDLSDISSACCFCRMFTVPHTHIRFWV